MPSPEVCATACHTVEDVVHRGRSLNRAAAQRLSSLPAAAQREAREISWGAIRWYYRYQPVLSELFHRPLKQNDKILEILVLCGLYQLDHLDEPDYAITSSTVETCRLLQREKARGLVNAVLRNYLRQKNRNPVSPTSAWHSMPEWLIRALHATWPIEWQAIVHACNEKPPLTLRINVRQCGPESYLQHLAGLGLTGFKSPVYGSAITLARPLPVDQIPGFSAGDVSVQDAAAQLTPYFTGDLRGRTVLDACASPGGKTCHLLEVATPQPSVTALDLPARTQKIEENLARLRLEAKVISGDATRPDEWWDGNPFDCIVVDAPCSATGVIRRHPDIRIHRRESDIIEFSKLQLDLLRALWPLLNPGGRLVYITCSILPGENDDIIEQFVGTTFDAQVRAIPLDIGIATDYGRQLLPQPGGSDGFFYSALDRTHT
jgi:16S rRNA (cytosine967-C5)-methyltransferase